MYLVHCIVQLWESILNLGYFKTTEQPQKGPIKLVNTVPFKRKRLTLAFYHFVFISPFI